MGKYFYININVVIIIYFKNPKFNINDKINIYIIKMKPLNNFILEQSLPQFSKNEIVDVLKQSNESPQEIKKDLKDLTSDEKTKTINYINFLKLYVQKLYEFIDFYPKRRNELNRREGAIMMGEKFHNKINNILIELITATNNLKYELNNISKNKINENTDISVKNLKNYEYYYNLFKQLINLEELFREKERPNENIIKKFNKKLFDDRKKVADLIGELGQYVNKLKEFIEGVTRTMNTPIPRR